MGVFTEAFLISAPVEERFIHLFETKTLFCTTD
jgi:hypothetical protein